MFHFERLAVGYFAALGVAVLLTRRHTGGWRAAAAAAVLAAAVLAAARALPPGARAWLGHLYLVAGYWVPALAAAHGGGGRFERWLSEADRGWTARLAAAPRWLTHAGEVSYLMCYPFVPAAFVATWLLGTPTDIDRFWVATLLAGYACYVSLPWLVALPPRLMPDAMVDGRIVARMNAALLSRVSHGLTTFPSGHVAVAIAGALALWPVSPRAAVIAGLVAAGISLGAATGRYHYVIDVMTGALVGIIGALLAFAVVSAQTDPRSAMVAEQIESRGVSDPRVLAAMRKVPRERFVPPEVARRAYEDNPLPIGFGQTISQPYIVAYMSEVLRTAPHHRVLEIGTGSGYQAAILAELAREVYTIEIVPELAQRAASVLKELGYRNVEVRAGDGYAGWPEHAPFDRILLTAAPEQIPRPLLDQLAPGGLLVAPVGAQGATQWITIAEKTGRGIVERRTIPVQFVPFRRGQR